MQALYLYINAALYLLFAVICAVAPAKTAAGLGFVSLTAGGRSEYLAVYGGLQLGLAIAFYLLARQADLNSVGIVFALVLYAPIVLFRLFSLARYWPVAGVTLATAVLELVFLLAAIGLYWSRP